jgi:hypothetical protein
MPSRPLKKEHHILSKEDQRSDEGISSHNSTQTLARG